MKIAKTCILLILINAFIIVADADELKPLIYQFTNPEVTVEFSEPLEVSTERQQEIAEELAGVTQTGINLDVPSPNNIICTLFGHDLAPQSTVTVTHHKDRQHSPRCLMEIYHVTYCKRCNYTVEELHNSFHIICCPED